MSKVIGIDLGTSNSCVSYIRDGVPVVIADEQGRATTPSIVAISSDMKPVVGYEAKAQADRNRLNTIFAVKRLIGRKYSSPEVREAAKKLPYKIVPSENGDAWVEIDGVATSPEEVSAHVLVKMRDIATQALGEQIHRAVITVPAHFNDAQRQATKEAGMIAGLEVLRIINEPTAAALAYGMDLAEGSEDKTIAVFDLGGGTFDISILEMKSGIFDVLSTNGDTYLGGEDFDMEIVSFLVEAYQKKTGVDLSNDKKALQRIKDVARDLKHTLTDVSKTTIALSFMAAGHDAFELEVDRKTLESVVRKVLQRLEKPCLQALQDAGLEPHQITDVILVGGMTRMPAVKSACQKIFGKPPHDTVDPDEAVSLGAAVQAGLLEGFIKGVSLLDVTSLSLGIEIQGAKTHVIVPRNSKIPVKVSEIFTTSAPNQPQVSIHVLQGESDFAPENKSLGMFELMGVRPAPRGEPSIEVTFEINAEGIVHVSARDLETGQEQRIEISADSGLSDTEVDKLLRQKRLEQEQASYRREREAQRLGVESSDSSDIAALRDSLRSLVFTTQAKLNTQGKGFKGQARTLLENSLSAARDIMSLSNEKEKLDAALLTLQQRARELDDYIDLLV